MPFYLEAIDLDEVFNEDNLVYGWVADAAQKGRVFQGYSGNHYIHQKYGDAEIYSCVVINEEEEKNSLEHFDLHVSGTCIWNVRLSEIALKNDTPCDMTRLLAVKNSSGNGLAIMHLINADVLPSFLEDDLISAQVVGFAMQVNYYKDEDAFADTIPECEGMKFEELNGKKLLPAIGSVLPTGFMHNHIVREDGTTRDDNDGDDLVLVTGLVKGAYADSVKLNDKEIAWFLRVKIGTQFGDLEIIHSRSMISDEEFELLKKADPQEHNVILNAVVVLSGDAAVNEYENGIIKDRENDLAALRYMLVKGNPKRLKTILAEDVIYESVNWEQVYQGRDKVINHLKYIYDTTKITFWGYLATLTEDDCNERCIVLAENDRDNLQSIVRIDVDDNGLITKIIITDVASDNFILDEKPDYDDQFLE